MPIQFQKNEKENGSRMHDISLSAVFKVCLAAFAVFISIKLFTVGLLLLLGLFVAVTLEPIVDKLRKFGIKRKFGIAVIAAALSLIIALVVFVLLPSIYEQIMLIVTNFPTLKAQIFSSIPRGHVLRPTVEEVLNNSKHFGPGAIFSQMFSMANIATQAFLQVLLVFIFSIYLLIDGKKTFKWFCDFFEAPTRMKLQATASESSKVVHGYVRGQVMTSVLTAVFTFIGLTVFGVPGALAVAFLAGVADVIPVLGFVITIVPALLLALTVSPETALAVSAYFVLYRAIESYFIVPIVYSNSLKVSPLVVLLALLSSGIIAGILGAIAILPIVASYPIIERIWLVKYLGRHVVNKRSEETDISEVAEQARLWNEKLLDLSRTNMAPRSRRQGSRTRGTILVVEDDLDISSTLEEVLKLEGFNVIVANNGQEGLEVLSKDNQISLIFLDMMMPVMNGALFLTYLKKDPALKDLPVVFLSDSASIENAPGASEYLKKPIDLDALVRVVHKYHYYQMPASNLHI